MIARRNRACILVLPWSRYPQFECLKKTGLMNGFNGSDRARLATSANSIASCSARFEIDPTTAVTIRGGSGTSSHFSFRMIRIYQLLDPSVLNE